MSFHKCWDPLGFQVKIRTRLKNNGTKCIDFSAGAMHHRQKQRDNDGGRWNKEGRIEEEKNILAHFEKQLPLGKSYFSHVSYV